MIELTIEDRLAAAVRHARKVKEQQVRDVKGKRGHTDIMTVVEAWRGVEPVCVAMLPPDRDRMLDVASLLARGLGADMLTMVNESYEGKYPFESDDLEEVMRINPDTGEEWAQGDLQAYFEKHGPDNEYVTEALLITAFNRAGDEALQSLRYKIVGRGIEWGEPGEPWVMHEDSDKRTKGVVPEAMRLIMNDPTVHQVMADKFLALGPDEETRYAVSDMATLVASRQLQETPDREGNTPPIMMMMFAEPGSKRHQVLRGTLGRGALLNPAEWN